MIKVTGNNTGSVRRSGRTFRKLLSALEKASEGAEIVYINQDQNMCKWSFDKAMGIISSYLMVERTPVNKGLYIEFPSKGSISFMTWKAFQRRNEDGKHAKIKAILDED